MEVAGLGSNMLGDRRQKCDDVVLYFALNLVDPANIEAAACFRGLGSLFGDEAEFCHGLSGFNFDLEPNSEFVLWLPDVGHLGTAVARNHRDLAFPRSRQPAIEADQGPSAFYVLKLNGPGLADAEQSNIDGSAQCQGYKA